MNPLVLAKMHFAELGAGGGLNFSLQYIGGVGARRVGAEAALWAAFGCLLSLARESWGGRAARV